MTREELLTIAKPILFNTEMVKAILEGRKTVTRRVVKFIDGKNPNWTGYIKDGLTLYNGTNEPCNKKPPYAAGDYLYVRETWCDDRQYTKDDTPGMYFYKADEKVSYNEKWKPSIHMPKEAARLFLRVTNVRVERLQDITEEQATKEGCQAGFREYKGAIWGQEDTDEWTAVEAFQELWNSTIKKQDLNKYGWEVNPWVWVIEFERVEVQSMVEREIKTTEQTDMDKLTTEMVEHICDNLCRHPRARQTQDELDDICAECKMGKFVCDILNTYNRLNDFEKSQTHKLLKELSKYQKYQNLEEQGLLRRLPCKPGDKIYVIPSEVNFKLNIINGYEENNRVYKQEVNEIRFYPSGEYLLTTCEGLRSALQQLFGITWFLTEQEAQVALEKMKAGGVNG